MFLCDLILRSHREARRLGHVVQSLILAIVSAAALFTLGTADAEARPAPDSFSASFEVLAREAETALSDTGADASREQLQKLEDLRAQLAQTRDIAGRVSLAGTLETRTLEAQIKDLGPLPAEGATEPSAITSKREELDKRLAVKLEPVLRVREMRTRAATLVSELDQKIDEQKHRNLVRRGKSPLDPRLWLKAATETGRGFSEAAANFGVKVGENGLGSILLMVAGAVFVALLTTLLFGRFWTRVRAWLEREIATSRSLARNLGLLLAVDLGSAAVFAVSLIFVTIAFLALIYPFLKPDHLLGLGLLFAAAALVPAIAQWLGRSVFNSPYKQLRLIRLSEERARIAPQTVRNSGIVLAVVILLTALKESEGVGTNFVDLLTAVFVLLGSTLLWRLARMIASARKEARREALAARLDDDPEPAEEFDFATPLGQFLKLFALASFVTALVGYVPLASEIFSSVMATLAVIAIAIYLNRTIKLIASAIGSSLKAYRRSFQFLPMVTGLVLLAGSLLLIALIWGYRPQEIGDGLTALRDGIDFGDVRISAGDVFTFALVFFIGYVATRFVQRFLRLSILPQFELDRGGIAAIVTAVGYIGVILAALVAIASTGLDLSSLAFVAGALSVGLGFGLQSVVENFTSGILLLAERPIKEGDWIEVGEFSGIVRKISVRSTQLETFDRHFIIIPNSLLITGSVKNLSFTGGAARIRVPVGVSYDADVDRVHKLLKEIALSLPNVLSDPEPAVLLTDFGDSSINFDVLCFVADVTTGSGTQSELNLEIARRFASEGIEIPFPQREIHIKHEDALLPTAPEAPPTKD